MWVHLPYPGPPSIFAGLQSLEASFSENSMLVIHTKGICQSTLALQVAPGLRQGVDSCPPVPEEGNVAHSKRCSLAPDLPTIALFTCCRILGMVYHRVVPRMQQGMQMLHSMTRVVHSFQSSG